ncbi:hypothetical protein ACPB67_02505 [Micromonospora taraxaci]|uniref:hypothetical protein n=1 Tax=Micromonospora taraxaci TaxID=1316803 RepID=UPI003C2C03CD
MPGIRDEDGRLIKPYVFESTYSQPDGIRVQVVITIPAETFWQDVQEAGEVAQMTASRALTQINGQIKAAQERVPF